MDLSPLTQIRLLSDFFSYDPVTCAVSVEKNDLAPVYVQTMERLANNLILQTLFQITQGDSWCGASGCLRSLTSTWLGP